MTRTDDVEAQVETFVRHPPIGMSTLDLLSRISSEGLTAWNDHNIPAKVRREMHQLAKTEMTEARRIQQADRPRVHDINTLGLAKDSPPLGEQIRQSKSKFVHGRPVHRRLIAGRLTRSTDLDEDTLRSSVSMPELSRSIARQVKGLKDRPELEQDALDVALSSSTSPNEDCKSGTKIAPDSPAEKERRALRQQESFLQSQLLHVTQKLSRKYQRQLVPREELPVSTCKIHTLAQKWQAQHSPKNVNAVDQEQYKLYVAGRFSTQMELDYYRREIEPREPATDQHRRHTIHTKYGNALVKTKCSLRGPF